MIPKRKIIKRISYNDFFDELTSTSAWTIPETFSGIWEFINSLCVQFGYSQFSLTDQTLISESFGYLYGDRLLNLNLDDVTPINLVEAEQIKNRITTCITLLNRDKYIKLIRLLADTENIDKYNPLNNFRVEYSHEDKRTDNLQEKHTGTDTLTKTLNTTVKDKTNYGKTDNGEFKHGETITDSGNYHYGKTTNHNTTLDNTTNSVFPYDSTTAHDASKITHTNTSSDVESGTDTNGNNRTHGGTDTTKSTLSGSDETTRTSTGTVTDANQKNTTIANTGTENREGKATTTGYKPFSGSANIQAAVKAEYDILPMSLVDEILKDIAEYILIPYYGREGDNIYF